MNKAILPFFLLLLFSCFNKNLNHEKSKYSTVRKLSDLKTKSENDTLNIVGYIKEYRNKKEGKDTGQFFSYEIRLSKKDRIPIKNTQIIEEKYVGKYVQMLAILKNEPIHNEPCPPYCQNTSLFFK